MTGRRRLGLGSLVSDLEFIFALVFVFGFMLIMVILEKYHII